MLKENLELKELCLFLDKERTSSDADADKLHSSTEALDQLYPQEIETALSKQRGVVNGKAQFSTQ